MPSDPLHAVHPASELTPIPPRHAFWHAYDPASKSELFATAISDKAGRLVVVDPIPLTEQAENELSCLGTVSAIVVTNENHWRAASQFSAEFKAPVFADTAPLPDIPGPLEPLDSLPALIADVAVISIEGAAPGEIGLHFPADGGTLIVGDSLIHFDPYGLALLPKKYCSDQNKMRLSLQQLLLLRFERLFFAHGLPILNQAMPRLQSLLNHE